MNKKDLISKIADKTSLTKKDVEAVIDGITEVITESLASGEEVNIAGFGKFLTRKRAARTGRNPQTGEEMQIAETTSPAFKPGKKLKEAVN